MVVSFRIVFKTIEKSDKKSAFNADNEAEMPINQAFPLFFCV